MPVEKKLTEQSTALIFCVVLLCALYNLTTFHLRMARIQLDYYAVLGLSDPGQTHLQTS